MLDYMPNEILGLCIGHTEGVEAPPLPRMYGREFEVEVFALGGMATDVKFIAIGSRLRPNLKLLHGAVDVLRKACDFPVVAISPSFDYWQKEWLVSRRVPFIQDERNAYLPFMGFVVQDSSRGRRPSPLSPQAQRIVVNLIQGDWDNVSAGDLARMVGKSRASVSKYLAEIEAICPHVVRRVGRSAVLNGGGIERADLLDCFEPFLRSPVLRRFRISFGVSQDRLCEVGARLSSLSALERLSDLAIGEAYPTVAIPQAHLAETMSGLGETVEELPWWNEEGIEVEVWGYWDDHPTDLLGQSASGLDAVARLSLYLSLRGRYEGEVRVADAIDQLREDICQ